jgi:hypothetical protein
MIDRQYSSYCFLASELSIEKKIKYSRQAAYSQARKQYDEYCLSIMQTITYAHDRVHFQGNGWVAPFDLREWN